MMLLKLHFEKAHNYPSDYYVLHGYKKEKSTSQAKAHFGLIRSVKGESFKPFTETKVFFFFLKKLISLINMLI